MEIEHDRHGLEPAVVYLEVPQTWQQSSSKRGKDPACFPVTCPMEAINYLELESCDMLNEIIENMKSIGVEIHLARVKHEVMEMLKKVGVDQFIGHDHIHNKVFEAVQLYTQKKKPGATNDR